MDIEIVFLIFFPRCGNLVFIYVVGKQSIIKMYTNLGSLSEALKIVKSGLFQLMSDLCHLDMHNP